MNLGNMVINVTADTGNVQSQLQGLRGSLSNLNLAEGLEPLSRMAQKIGEISKMGFDYNDKMEQNMASFETLLGSTDKAKTHLADLTKFAANTPFEIPDLANASKMMLGFGIESKDIMKNMQMLGDASLGNKEKFKSMTYAFSQIQAAGKATMGDIAQLINAGFNPLGIISKKTGKSMGDLRKAVENGSMSAEMISEAFRIATSEGGRFFGGMEKQSKTFSGMLSTLSDNVNMLLGSAMKPLFDMISQKLMPRLLSVTEALKNKFEKLSPFWQKFIGFAMVGVGALVPLIATVGSGILVFNTFSTMLGICGTALLGLQARIGSYLVTLGGFILRNAAASTGLLSFAKSTVVATIKTAGLVALIASAAAGAYVLVRSWSTIPEWWSALWDNLKSGLSQATNIMYASIALVNLRITQLFKKSLDQVKNAIASFMDMGTSLPLIGDKFKGLGDTIRNIDILKGAEDLADSAFAKMYEGNAILQKSADRYNKITSQMKGKAFGGIKEEILGVGKDIEKDLGQKIDPKVFDGLKSGLDDVGKKSAKTAETIANSFKDALKSTKDKIKSMGGFAGIFDVAKMEKVSWKDLRYRMQQQLKIMEEFKSSMKNIGQRMGYESPIYRTLLEQGPSATGQIKALASMPDNFLREFSGNFNEKFNIATPFAAQQTAWDLKQEKMMGNITFNITEASDPDKIVREVVKQLKYVGVY